MIKPGFLFRQPDSDSLCRIIAADNIEVLYDVQSEDGEWQFAKKPKGPCYYYRSLTKVVTNSWIEVGEMPFSEEESAVFRQDLPLRLCRYQHIQWNTTEIENLDEFKTGLTGTVSGSNIILNTDKIQLVGLNSSKRPTKPQLIHALSQDGFSEDELIWRANNVQAPLMKKVATNGIGIYRLGHEKEVPTFYTGGFIDLAGFLSKV